MSNFKERNDSDGCSFCHKVTNDFGGFLLKENVKIHKLCLLFSCGIAQKEKVDNGLYGFRASDIAKEIKRSSRLRCSYCKGSNASIGCNIKSCSISCHYGCGKQNSALFQYYGSFKVFCEKHRPQQNLTTKEVDCCICFGEVNFNINYNYLLCSNCRALMHRDCIQNFATTSGKHFFKCPLCLNSKEFGKEMLKHGIDLPDRDALWETDDYQSAIMDRNTTCSAPTCYCPKGIKFQLRDSPWEFVTCDTCGWHNSTHMSCSSLKTPYDSWLCPDCILSAPLVSSPPAKKRKTTNIMKEKRNEILFEEIKYSKARTLKLPSSTLKCNDPDCISKNPKKKVSCVVILRDCQLENLPLSGGRLKFSKISETLSDDRRKADGLFNKYLMNTKNQNTE